MIKLSVYKEFCNENNIIVKQIDPKTKRLFKIDYKNAIDLWCMKHNSFMINFHKAARESNIKLLKEMVISDEFKKEYIFNNLYPNIFPERQTSKSCYLASSYAFNHKVISFFLKLGEKPNSLFIEEMCKTLPSNINTKKYIKSLKKVINSFGSTPQKLISVSIVNHNSIALKLALEYLDPRSHINQNSLFLPYKLYNSINSTISPINLAALMRNTNCYDGRMCYYILANHCKISYQCVLESLEYIQHNDKMKTFSNALSKKYLLINEVIKVSLFGSDNDFIAYFVNYVSSFMKLCIKNYMEHFIPKIYS